MQAQLVQIEAQLKRIADVDVEARKAEIMEAMATVADLRRRADVMAQPTPTEPKASGKDRVAALIGSLVSAPWFGGVVSAVGTGALGLLYVFFQLFGVSVPERQSPAADPTPVIAPSPGGQP